MVALNRLSSFIKQHALFLPEERVLLAVSGGRDSIVMVHLFKAAGFNFGIAHCNFNMRADESDKDEKFTSDLASELDAPFFATTFNTSEYAKSNHISVQMAARDLRYKWLEEIRSDFGYDYIAVAHHQNDIMETMLLNLTRGTGVSGMHGILPKKDKLIRPILFLTRDEIDVIVKESGFEYRDDLSNFSTKYARNKIRLNVIPVLKELNPSLEQTFEANQKRFAELEILLDRYTEDLKTRLFKKLSDDEYEISLPELKKLAPINTLLYSLFSPYGFSAQVLHDLSKSWDGFSGKVFSSANYNLLLDRERVILSKISVIDLSNLNITADDTLISWNGREFNAGHISSDKITLDKRPGIAQVDYDLLQFPLTLRTWKAGDYFQPLGMNGKKKLSDFFIEQKIPLNHKKDVAILQNNNGDIIWVAGLRIDNRYKITSNTKKVFIFEQFT
jgi:tRNA(Ile)-lysidine synthase